MLAKIFLSATLAAALTVAGSLWIDKLYSRSSELSFPAEISARAKFRKPLLFFALTILFSLTDDLFLTPAIFLLMLMTFTDFEQYMLFDAMTFPLAIFGAVYAWQNSVLFDNFLAAAVFGGIFLLFAVTSKGSLGGGDIKLIAALGLWLGGEKLFNVVIVGTIAGGLAAILLILAKKKDRKSYFAYGPYFTLSALYFLLAA